MYFLRHLKTFNLLTSATKVIEAFGENQSPWLLTLQDVDVWSTIHFCKIVFTVLILYPELSVMTKGPFLWTSHCLKKFVGVYSKSPFSHILQYFPYPSDYVSTYSS